MPALFPATSMPENNHNELVGILIPIIVFLFLVVGCAFYQKSSSGREVLIEDYGSEGRDDASLDELERRLARMLPVRLAAKIPAFKVASMEPDSWKVLFNSIQNYKTLAVEEVDDRDLLLDHQDEFGNTLLHYAAVQGNEENIRRLIDYSPGCLDIENDDGKVPEDCAGEREIREILIQQKEKRTFSQITNWGFEVANEKEAFSGQKPGGNFI